MNSIKYPELRLLFNGKSTMESGLYLNETSSVWLQTKTLLQEYTTLRAQPAITITQNSKEWFEQKS